MIIKTGMADQPSLRQIAETLRNIYSSDKIKAPASIEAYLANILQEVPPSERVAVLHNLQAEFGDAMHGGSAHFDLAILNRLVPLLLGKTISQDDFASPDLLDRLATSLNTIFDNLNELIHVIHTALGGTQPGEETIRQIIGVNLDSQSETQSLEEYLGQIKQAFLITHQALQNTAQKMVGSILSELDPKQIASSGGAGLKFGPLRKAESFDILEEKYVRCKKWFESERFLEDLLREFEKNCQKLFT
ncbi:MAG: hypothetical protein JW920_08000 [Deltaproteobacteria bacterium]|nr:hypothetical protein [Deltaproteobacteria bacterium]